MCSCVSARFRLKRWAFRRLADLLAAGEPARIVDGAFVALPGSERGSVGHCLRDRAESSCLSVPWFAGYGAVSRWAAIKLSYGPAVTGVKIGAPNVIC